MRDAVGALDVLLFSKLFRPVEIVTDTLHAKGIGADRDFAANTTKTNNANGLTHDFVARHTLPTARGSCVGLLHQVFAECQDQHEDMLRNRGVIHAGTKADGNLILSRIGNVDLVDADTILCNDF